MNNLSFVWHFGWLVASFVCWIVALIAAIKGQHDVWINYCLYALICREVR